MLDFISSPLDHHAPQTPLLEGDCHLNHINNLLQFNMPTKLELAVAQTLIGNATSFSQVTVIVHKQKTLIACD